MHWKLLCRSIYAITLRLFFFRLLFIQAIISDFNLLGAKQAELVNKAFDAGDYQTLLMHQDFYKEFIL